MVEAEYIDQPLSSSQETVSQAATSEDRSPTVPETPEQFLARIATLPETEAIEAIQGLATNLGYDAVPFLSIVAQKAELGLALKAIDILGKQHSVQAATALATVGANRSDARRAKEARRALYKLSLVGIKPEAVVAPSRPEPEPDRVYACLASTIDGDGKRSITVVRQNRFGTLRLGVFLLDEKTGIYDVLGRDPCSMSLWRQYLADAETRTKLVPVELAFCRRQVEIAAARNERTGTPLPDNYYRFIHLIEGPSEERPRPPELDPEVIRADPELLANSVRLCDMPECAMWLFPSTEVRPYAERVMAERTYQKREDNLGLPDLGRVRWEGEQISAALKTLVDGARRSLFQERLEYTADLLWRSDRLEEARWAMAAALALAPDSALPVEQHPLLRKIMANSLEEAITEEEETTAGKESTKDEEELGSSRFTRRESGLYVPR